MTPRIPRPPPFLPAAYRVRLTLNGSSMAASKKDVVRNQSIAPVPCRQSKGNARTNTSYPINRPFLFTTVPCCVAGDGRPGRPSPCADAGDPAHLSPSPGPSPFGALRGWQVPSQPLIDGSLNFRPRWQPDVSSFQTRPMMRLS